MGQVRLRHRSEPVLARHMVSGAPIAREDAPGVLRARAAHFTFNPFPDARARRRAVFPAAAETVAQRRFLATGLATAQLSPGVFTHLGAGRSRGLALPGAGRGLVSLRRHAPERSASSCASVSPHAAAPTASRAAASGCPKT